MEVRLKSLKKSYRGQIVLDVDDICFERGKITGAMGPNGSGKSTMLNIIAGLDDDYDGVVTYEGGPLDSSIRSKITLAFQHPYLMRMSVWDNIEYPLKIRGIDKNNRQAEVMDILKRLGIEGLMDKRADRLSGGEGQRVSLARAMVQRPKLLMLDEPTASIDQEYTKTIEEEIIRYNQNTNATIIMITHDSKQAQALCHRVICLDKGKPEVW